MFDHDLCRTEIICLIMEQWKKRDEGEKKKKKKRTLCGTQISMYTYHVYTSKNNCEILRKWLYLKVLIRNTNDNLCDKQWYSFYHDKCSHTWGVVCKAMNIFLKKIIIKISEIWFLVKLKNDDALELEFECLISIIWTKFFGYIYIYI